jgi:hypothetical protein
LVLLVAFSCLLSACSGVPTSSAPEKITAVGAGDNPTPTYSAKPLPNETPNDVVKNFIDATLSTQDDHHVGAKAFLTPAAAAKWTGTNQLVQVVSSHQLIGPDVNASNPNQVTVRFSASSVATINATTGIYQPDLGNVDDQVLWPFSLQKYKGVWLISNPPPQLYVYTETFASSYNAHPLYFFDSSGKHLIPDLRWTSFTDPSSLDSWLVDELLSGPSNALAGVTSPDPLQGTDANASVVYDPATSAVTVHLPGAADLDDDSKYRLAEQLAATLASDTTTQVNSIGIVDRTKPVLINKLGGAATFAVSNFADLLSPGTGQADLYYLDHQRPPAQQLVAFNSGTPTPAVWPGGPPATVLDTVAVASERPPLASQGSQNMLIAGTASSRGRSRLLVGSLDSGLHQIVLPAGIDPKVPLTQPTWVPDAAEVWVASGTSIIRVPIGSNELPGRPSVLKLPGATGLPTKQPRIESLQLSPEGSRLAMVITSAEAATGSQIWVGAVQRSGSGAIVSNLAPITRLTYVMSRVVWGDATTLLGIGGLAGQPRAVYKLGVDGSNFVSQSSPTSEPDTITATQGLPTYVSAANGIFVYSGTTPGQGGIPWTYPNANPNGSASDPGTPTPGESPTYSQ